MSQKKENEQISSLQVPFFQHNFAPDPLLSAKFDNVASSVH
jgi:hypothetical protein